MFVIVCQTFAPDSSDVTSKPGSYVHLPSPELNTKSSVLPLDFPIFIRALYILLVIQIQNSGLIFQFSSPLFIALNTKSVTNSSRFQEHLLSHCHLVQTLLMPFSGLLQALVTHSVSMLSSLLISLIMFISPKGVAFCLQHSHTQWPYYMSLA